MGSLYGRGNYGGGNYSAPDYVDISGRPFFANFNFGSPALSVVQVVDLTPARFLLLTHLTGRLSTTQVLLAGSMAPAVAMQGALSAYVNLTAVPFPIRTGVASALLSRLEWVNLQATVSVDFAFEGSLFVTQGWRPQPPCPGGWDDLVPCEDPGWAAAPAPAQAFGPGAPCPAGPWMTPPPPPPVNWVT